MQILTKENILLLVEENYREGSSLLFWSGEKFSFNDTFINSLAKNISALANKGEAQIIIGIKSIRGRAVKLESIQSDFSVDFLQNEIQTRIERKIKGLKLYKVKIDDNSYTLIVNINEHNDAPHMFKDGRFYIWNGSRSVVMSEVQVRFTYKSTTKPELEYIGIYNTNGLPIMSNGRLEEISFYPKILIQNKGLAVEKDYKIEIQIPSSLVDDTFSPLQSYFVRYERDFMVFSIKGKEAVYADEIINPLELKLKVKSDNYSDFFTSELQIRIFYSNGVHTSKFKINDYFKYNGKPIIESDF